MHRMVHHSENLFIKYHEQTICRKFAFSGQHWTGIFIKKCKNSVFGVPIKISISALNFSTESVKKPTINDLLFLIVIYSPKTDN